MITTPIAFTADLDKPLRKAVLPHIFLTGDGQAHRILVNLTRGGKRAEIGQASVSGYLIRPDGATVILHGTLEDSTACVTLTDPCYAAPGRFTLAVRLTLGDTRTAVLWAEGAISRSSTDALVDDGNIVPSLDELLARLEDLESATDRAEALADQVEEKLASGAFNGKGLTILGFFADESSLSSVSDPQPGDAYGVGADGDCTLFVWDAVNLAWVDCGPLAGIPGATPMLTIGSVTEGEEAAASITGTAENPVLHLTLPRGSDATVPDLAPVATSGSYTDLTDQPAPGMAFVFDATSGWLESAVSVAANAWYTIISYEVEIPRTGVYLLNARLGCTSGGSSVGSGHMQLLIDDNTDYYYPHAQGWCIPPKANVYTGGMVTLPVTLTAGVHTFALRMNTTVASKCYGYGLKITEVKHL